MIVYREAKTLARDLGFSIQTLYAVSNSLPRHYHSAELPKRDGTVRHLSVPDPLLKTIQRRIADRLLPLLPVSPYATAYRCGAGPLRNAAPHAGNPLILKLDIRDFFGSVLYSAVKESAFPASIYAEPLRVLLTMLCYYDEGLPQGAPSSPAISNLILRDFDRTVGSWCAQRGIAYTRYCDDLTFSGSFDAGELQGFVQAELRRQGFFLNPRKTRLLPAGGRQIVTGLTVNQHPAVPPRLRRELRQELYYCRHYGVAEHLARTGRDLPPRAYLQSLLGRVGYVLQIEPGRTEALQWRAWLLETLSHMT